MQIDTGPSLGATVLTEIGYRGEPDNRLQRAQLPHPRYDGRERPKSSREQAERGTNKAPGSYLRNKDSKEQQRA